MGLDPTRSGTDRSSLSRDPSAFGVGSPASGVSGAAPRSITSGAGAAPTAGASPAATRGGGPVFVRPTKENPATFWDQVMGRDDMTPTTLWLNLLHLRRQGNFVEAQLAVWSFLTHHGPDAQPWMYEALATLLALNNRPSEQSRAALGYAADLALRSGRGDDLTRVADSLHMEGDNARAGELLDRAVEIEPSNARPLLMSIQLASRVGDRARMTRSFESLLALGWPDRDEEFREAARAAATEMAANLRVEGRTQEADALLDRLTRALSRDLVARLTWQGQADLSLRIEEPLGAVATSLEPRTVFGGALVANGYGRHPEEIYVCPRGFSGTYTVTIETVYDNPDDPAREIQLELITHEGTEREKIQSHRVDLAAPPTIRLELAGGRRTQVLPYQSSAAPSGPIVIPLEDQPDAARTASPGQPGGQGPTPTARDAADALRVPGPGSSPGGR